MENINFLNRITKVGLLAFCCLYGKERVNAQATTTIFPNGHVLKAGMYVDVPASNFVNDGSFADTTSPGVFNADGGVNFYGSGTTSLYDIGFINGGTSVLNSLVSVYNTATIEAGTIVDANNNLNIRSDLKRGANLIVEGVLTNVVQGIIAYASAYSGTGPSYPSLLSVNIFGSVVKYQWESSNDNTMWVAVSGATNATYDATVTSTIYYRCNTSTSNSSFTNTTPGVKLTIHRRSTSIGNAASQPISLCPNPTKGIIFINSPAPVNIKVWDMAGGLIKYTGFSNSISISEFPAGSYIVRLYSDVGELVYEGKVVKE